MSLRGVVVGCGHMGRFHANKLLERGDVELVGVVDPGSPHHPALPRLPAAPLDVDFAVVAAPTRLHYELALPLLEAGVPCLVEKPLAATLEDARELAALPGVCVNHIERFNPAVAALPRGLRPRFLKLARLASPNPRGTDVDVVHDLMVHDLDQVLYLTGSPVVDLRAVGVPVLTDGVDIAEVWLETASGCVATLTASRVSPEGVRELRAVTGDTYWSLDLARRTARVVPWGRQDLGAREVEVPPTDALASMVDAFLAAVRGERPYPVSGPEGLAALELARDVAEQIAARLDS